MSNPWFRMYTDFLNDPKMISLAFEDQRHFIGVLALKSDGALDQQCDEKLLDRIVSQRLWVEHETIWDVKHRLVNAGLIDFKWQPVEWKKHKPSTERLPSHIWNALRSRIFTRDNYTCQYCGEHGGRLECDHVVPVSGGGGNDESNLKTSCFSCNRSKHTKSINEWSGANG
jgi:5-methylcytosine-specific restriction endonuclease McrA